MTVSMKPLPITAICATNTGQPRRTISRKVERREIGEDIQCAGRTSAARSKFVILGGAFHRLVDHAAAQLRREELNEGIRIGAQEGAATERDARGVAAEKVARIERTKRAIALCVEGDGGDDADAETDLD